MNYEITIEGVRPLLMHNGLLSDPLHPAARRLSAAAKKRDKSESDHMEMAELEFVGGLYYDEKLGPYLPPDNLEAVLVEGARKRKLGKIFEASLMVVVPDDAPGYKLEYTDGAGKPGPRTLEGMLACPALVFRCGARVSGRRGIQRTRPRFPTGWTCTFEVEVMSDDVQQAQLQQAVVDAGLLVGLGDWRPKYGRFHPVEMKRVRAGLQ